MNVTTSFTPINSPTDGRNSRMESRVHGNVHARFGGGDTPYPKGSTVPTLRKDFPKAPQGLCKHRLGAATYQRATPLAKQWLEAQLDSNRNGHQATAQPAKPPKAEAIASLPEAPASCNVYVMLAGRKVQLTLRDQDEQRLLARLEQLLQRFPAEEEAEQEPPEGWCTKHGVQMHENTKDGRRWWSHRWNGQWCKGR
jgi:hypothetical protein